MTDRSQPLVIGADEATLKGLRYQLRRTHESAS